MGQQDKDKIILQGEVVTPAEAAERWADWPWNLLTIDGQKWPKNNAIALRFDKLPSSEGARKALESAIKAVAEQFFPVAKVSFKGTLITIAADVNHPKAPASVRPKK